MSNSSPSLRRVPTDKAAELLCIGKTRLGELRKTGELKAGEHWFYKLGHKHGGIVWDVEACFKWQSQSTLAAIKAAKENVQAKATAIESFDEPDPVTTTKAGA